MQSDAAESIASPYTTISVSEATRDEIKDLKRGGETYEEVLQRLLREHNDDSESE